RTPRISASEGSEAGSERSSRRITSRIHSLRGTPFEVAISSTNRASSSVNLRQRVVLRKTVLLVFLFVSFGGVRSAILIAPCRYTCVYRPQRISCSLCGFTLVYLHDPRRGGVSKCIRCEAPLWYCHGCRRRIMLSIPPQMPGFGMPMMQR